MKDGIWEAQDMARYIAAQQAFMATMIGHPNMIYPHNAAAMHPDRPLHQLLEAQEERLTAAGFTCYPDQYRYEYSGDNPYEALTAFINLGLKDVLVLECTTALNLTCYLALKETVGREQFNRIIAQMEGGKLVISTKTRPPFLQTIHYVRSMEDSILAKEPLRFDEKDLQDGDMVYMAGTAAGYAVHPAGDLNGFNLLRMGPDKFMGFFDIPEPEEVYNQQYYFDLFRKAFDDYLTVEDLYWLNENGEKFPNQFMKNSLWECKIMKDLIINDEAKKILNEYKKSGKSRFVKTEIRVPEAFRGIPVIGAMFILRPVSELLAAYAQADKKAFEEAKREYTPIHIDKRLPITHYEEFSKNLSFDFSRYQPCVLLDELAYFYKRCDARIRGQMMGGLLLHGGKGGTLTQACLTLLKALNEHYTVECIHDDRNLMPDFTHQVFTSILEQKGLAACLETIIKENATQWKDIDVFFIENAKQDKSKMGLMTQALIIYCKRHHKQLLMTGTLDYDKEKLDWVRIAYLEGNDCTLKEKAVTAPLNFTWNKKLPAVHPAPKDKSKVRFTLF